MNIRDYVYKKKKQIDKFQDYAEGEGFSKIPLSASFEEYDKLLDRFNKMLNKRNKMLTNVQLVRVKDLTKEQKKELGVTATTGLVAIEIHTQQKVK